MLFLGCVNVPLEPEGNSRNLGTDFSLCTAHFLHLPMSLAGLGQAQGEARADRPQASQSGGGAEAVVEAAKVAADLRAERRLDSVLEVRQARGGISVGPAAVSKVA